MPPSTQRNRATRGVSSSTRLLKGSESKPALCYRFPPTRRRCWREVPHMRRLLSAQRAGCGSRPQMRGSHSPSWCDAREDARRGVSLLTLYAPVLGIPPDPKSVAVQVAVAQVRWQGRVHLPLPRVVRLFYDRPVWPQNEAGQEDGVPNVGHEPAHFGPDACLARA